jgi:hypothetical protein
VASRVSVAAMGLPNKRFIFVWSLGLIACGDTAEPQKPGSNTPPVAVLVTPTVAPVAVPVVLDASLSYDADGEDLRYAFWTAGTALDGDSQSKPSFTFAHTGRFAVQLQVTDGHGTDATVEAEITVRDEYPSPPNFCVVVDDCPIGDACKAGVCYLTTRSE